MKTLTWTLLLVGLASTGCVWDQSFSWPPGQKPGAEVMAAKSQRSHPSGVRPEQVNEDNAQRMAQALEAEMDADAEAPPLSPEDSTPGKSGKGRGK